MSDPDPAGRAEPAAPAGENTARAGRTARLGTAALGWLPASPAVVALVAAALPWFSPSGQGKAGSLSIPDAFSWQAGRIGYFAPLVLVVAALSVLAPRHGWYGKNAPPHTFARDGWYLVVAGVVAGGVLALTWVLLPKTYTFPGGLSWDTLTSAGFRLRRNPQPGYFLAIAAGADALVCGVVYLSVARRESRATQPDEAGKIDNHDGKDPGR